jgi:microcystin-dependent protein
MATVTPGKIFSANEIVTPANLNALGVPTVSNIETADMNPSVPLVPTGAIMPFAMNSAPSGWLAANGTAVSRTTYATLFAAVGTTYGTGDGSTTFNLPDLRGYFVRGAGTNTDGLTAGTFGAKQTGSVGPHTHSGTTGNDSPDHTHSTTFRASSGYGVGTPSATASGFATTAEYSSSGASARHQHSFTTSSQSPSGTTETRPANIALLYCIKF